MSAHLKAHKKYDCEKCEKIFKYLDIKIKHVQVFHGFLLVCLQQQFKPNLLVAMCTSWWLVSPYSWISLVLLFFIIMLIWIWMHHYSPLAHAQSLTFISNFFSSLDIQYWPPVVWNEYSSALNWSFLSLN